MAQAVSYAINSRIRERLARRRQGRTDAGFALPTVMLGVIASLGLGSAMVSASLSATAGTTRDTNSKSAFAVAEAGVSQALFRYNRFDTSNPSEPSQPLCLNEAAGGQVVLEPVQTSPPALLGWCRPVTGSTSGGTYSYSVRPTAIGLTVVSTGTFEGLSRRIQVEAKYEAVPGNGGVTPFEDKQVFAKDGITINQGGRITADVGTYGTLTVGNGGQLKCDDAQAGATVFHNSKSSTCQPATPDFELPTVDSTVAESTNQNALLTGSGCHSWSETSKKLTISNSCSLTLGTAGTTTDFYICKLTLNNSAQLRIAAGATVNIWFAPPEECAMDTVPYVGAPGSKILTPGTSPPTTLAFIVSDSPTTTSMVLGAGGHNWPACTDNFIIYAPTTNLTLSTGPHVCGAAAAKSISIAPGSSMTKSSLSGVWELPGSTGGLSPHYVSSKFLECTTKATAGATPDFGC